MAAALWGEVARRGLGSSGARSAVTPLSPLPSSQGAAAWPGRAPRTPQGIWALLVARPRGPELGSHGLPVQRRWGGGLRDACGRGVWGSGQGGPWRVPHMARQPHLILELTARTPEGPRATRHGFRPGPRQRGRSGPNGLSTGAGATPTPGDTVSGAGGRAGLAEAETALGGAGRTKGHCAVAPGCFLHGCRPPTALGPVASGTSLDLEARLTGGGGSASPRTGLGQAPLTALPAPGSEGTWAQGHLCWSPVWTSRWAGPPSCSPSVL